MFLPEEKQTEFVMKDIYEKLGYHYMFENIDENAIQLLQKYVLPINFSLEKENYTICNCGHLTQTKNDKCFVCKQYNISSYRNNNAYIMFKAKEKLNTLINCYSKGKYIIKAISNRVVEVSYLKGSIGVVKKDGKCIFNADNLQEKVIRFILKKDDLYVVDEGKEMRLLKFMQLNNPNNPSENIFKLIKEIMNYQPNKLSVDWIASYNTNSLNYLEEKDFWQEYLNRVYFSKLDNDISIKLKNHNFFKSKNNYMLDGYFVYLINTGIADIKSVENTNFEDIFKLDKDVYEYMDNYGLLGIKKFSKFLLNLKDTQKENLKSLVNENFFFKLNIHHNLSDNDLESLCYIFLKKTVPIKVSELVKYIEYLEEYEGLNIQSIIKYYESYIKKSTKEQLLKDLYPKELKMKIRQL